MIIDTLHVTAVVKYLTDSLAQNLAVRIVGYLIVHENFSDLQEAVVLTVIDAQNVEKP
jgi:hypothetical protein